MENSDPVAELQIVVHAPVSRVFEAFIEPRITTKFWFTNSDGRLEPGKRVNWVWEKQDRTVPVQVVEVEQDKRILIQWGEDDDKSSVEWTFTAQSEESTFVKILNSNFIGSLEEIVKKAIYSQAQLSEMLGKAKGFLESNSEIESTAESHPEED